MKAILFALFFGLLMVGCGEEARENSFDPTILVGGATESIAEGPAPAQSNPLSKREQAAMRKRAEEIERQYGEIIAEAIDCRKLKFISAAPGLRKAIGYWPNEQKPYSGWTKSMHGNGQMESLLQWKGGKFSKSISWYSTGQKQEEGNYKDGEVVTRICWKINGEKCPHTTLKDGNGVVVYYNDDGTEAYRLTFKDGARVD